MNDSKRLITILIAGLIAYRVSRLPIADDGPFDVIAKARAKLEVNKQETWWQRGLSCIACVSFWVAPVVVFLMGERKLTRIMGDGLAASTVAILAARGTRV